MPLNYTDMAIAVVIIGVGCLVTYVSLQRRVRRAVYELQSTTERQLNALAAALKVLETRVSELSAGTGNALSQSAAASVPAPIAKTESATAVATVAVPQTKQEEVTPEMLVVIAAAVTVFLGKKVRIRSAKMLQSPYEIVNPWSQQGRVFVQASHNLRSRG